MGRAQAAWNLILEGWSSYKLDQKRAFTRFVQDFLNKVNIDAID